MNEMKRLELAGPTRLVLLGLMIGALSATPGIAYDDAAPSKDGGDTSSEWRGGGGGGRRGGDKGGPPFERILAQNAERLGLDQETQDQIKAIAKAARAEAKPTRELVRAKKDAMHLMLQSDAPVEAAIMQQADEIGALQTELRKNKLRSMLKIRKLLTPEQRKELVKIHNERRARREQRRAERGQGQGRGRGDPSSRNGDMGNDY
jgi:Spy/CpxP family protein refolding chaperone